MNIKLNNIHQGGGLVTFSFEIRNGNSATKVNKFQVEESNILNYRIDKGLTESPLEVALIAYIKGNLMEGEVA